LIEKVKMLLFRLVIFALAVVVAGASVGSRALPHGDIGSDKGGDLARLAEQANLVFIGRVVKVDYRLSDPRSGERIGLPHALVTYEVDSVLRGQAPGKLFTMRFIGGPDGRGRFMEVSGVPQFQPGEQDLLFVSSNGERDCPLVMCEWGRFRVLKAGVYNHHGFPVRAVHKTNVIARGLPPKELLAFRYPAPKFDDLIKNEEVQGLMKQQSMSIEDMRKRYEAEAPKQIELSRDIPAAASEDSSSSTGGPQNPAIASTPEDLPEGPIAIEEFTTVMKRILAQTKRQASPIRSIDPNATIRASSAKEQRLRRAEAGRVQAVNQTKEEAAELEALKKRDFNPVLKHP
jgi:hypothetical protein